MNKIDNIFNYLDELFPNPACELDFSNNYELLMAVILSAQCTDKRVNLVTPALFEKYKTPNDLANADLIELENTIKSCGFYHNKAKNMQACCRDLVTRFNGEVPNSFDKLITLQGVGQKTANVVLAVAFNQNYIGVDTHVKRIAYRLGLTKNLNPAKVEKDLVRELAGRKLATDHYLLVLFGRYFCKAKNPNCKECKIKEFCNHPNKN